MVLKSHISMANSSFDVELLGNLYRLIPVSETKEKKHFSGCRELMDNTPVFLHVSVNLQTLQYTVLIVIKINSMSQFSCKAKDKMLNKAIDLAEAELQNFLTKYYGTYSWL